MARQYGTRYSSSVVAGLVYVWTTARQETAYRLITRHYSGYWYAVGWKNGKKRYTATIEHEYRKEYNFCIIAPTAAEMQERVHDYIDTVIASWQIDEYARVYPAAEMPTELHQ